MDALVELEKYLSDLIKFQDNEMANLTLTLVLQKVHRMMDKYMEGVKEND